MIQELIDFIHHSPTSFHAVRNVTDLLAQQGYQSLDRLQGNIVPGGRYYITKNGSALIAFEIPEKKAQRILLAASHTDSPCFRIRDRGEMEGNYATLSVERYGGAINATWIDRPLSIAGRIVYRIGEGISWKLVDFEEDTVLIPNVAIHLNGELNSNPKYDLSRDFYPLYGMKGGSTLRGALSERMGIHPDDILSQDLFVYNNQSGSLWGADSEFLSAPRLDDLACVYGSLEALLHTENEDSIRMFAAFDNEEIGSGTLQGAESTMLPDLIDEICDALDLNKTRLLSQSMMLSCDNGHALHPNHPELSDRTEAPVLNHGIVLKHSPRYTTSGVSAGILLELCRRAGVPVQHYSNRPDKPGGSTLGNIAITKTGMIACDIGIPQLAMHSAFETCGAKDVEHFIHAVRAFYEAHLRMGEHEATIETV